MDDMKVCPYCAEEIRAEAVKCRYCGSRITAMGPVADWVRTSDDKMIAGVCGGLARQFGVPAALVRLAFVLMTVFTGGTGILVYVVLWIVMPKDEWRDEVDEIRHGGAP